MKSYGHGLSWNSYGNYWNDPDDENDYALAASHPTRPARGRFDDEEPGHKRRERVRQAHRVARRRSRWARDADVSEG